MSSMEDSSDYDANGLWEAWGLPETVNVTDRAIQPTENGEGPVVSAAGLASSSFLEALLTRPHSQSQAERSEWLVNQVRGENYNGGWITPILRAIEMHRSENIRLLLRHGAYVNGIDTESLKQHARRYRRVCINVEHADLCNHFTPVDKEDVGTVPSQTYPAHLTSAEFVRRRQFRSRFWADPHSTYLSYSHFGAAMHSVTMAAATTPAILDQLLEAGADCTFWKEGGMATSLPEEDVLSPSQLSTTTPLHTAIAAGKMDMVRALLDRGFDVNARAIVVGCHALTPIQCAVLLGIKEACALLKSHPHTDLSVTTPILGIHSLHFAAARYRLDLFQTFGIPIPAVPATAIGHTLLHIACLPQDVWRIQLLGPKILASIHDVCQLPPTGPFGMPLGQDPDLFEEYTKQKAMCMYLVQELGPRQIAATDIYGNTPLHYLASVKATNIELIAWMREQDGGDYIWHSSRNDWAHTPKDLQEDAEAATKRARAGPPPRGGGRKFPDMFNRGV
ncbi:hypothetical protein LTR86_003903 [Recurvomyces mirabilis]|nr:hypothetical protein LTR86_003903 [Recurvomyces mirabilis]